MDWVCFVPFPALLKVRQEGEEDDGEGIEWRCSVTAASRVMQPLAKAGRGKVGDPRGR